MTLTIVKLGGSAAFTPALRHLLTLLEGCGGRVCIVPGGGPFSESVRHAQSDMGFDDEAAHRMAILGMEQYAHALKSLCPSLHAVATRDDILDSSRAGSASLWFPAALLIDDETIDHSWQVTSDSLAVWMAKMCGVGRVVLIKQVERAVETDVLTLSRRGVVDAALPDMLADWPGALFIANAGAEESLRAAIMQDRFDQLQCVARQRGAA